MSGDYKMEAQLIAEILAEEKYGKNFYECTDQEQYELYTQALNRHFEQKFY